MCNKDKWDLSKIYKDDDSWTRGFKELVLTLGEFEAYEGTLGDSKKLLEYLKFSDEVERKMGTLGVYVHLKSDEDVSLSKYVAMERNLENYMAEVSARQSFFLPEIYELPEGRLEEMMEEEPGLEMYRFMLEDVLRSKPHIRSQECEEILAYAYDCLSAAENASHILQNSDMRFDDIIDEKGNKCEVSEGVYSLYATSADRETRKRAFQSLMTGYAGYSNTFSSLLTSSVKNCVFNANVRGYSSALESCLDDDNIPTDVYYNTIESTCGGLESLHRYVGLKKRILEMDEFHLYDLNSPIISGSEDMSIDFDEAVGRIKEALAPLGVEYVEQFQKGVDERWIDRYPSKGKAAGAYSSGAYDTMPYVLLNYNSKYEDVLTLSHEMGHSMHSWYSRKTQPFVDSQYSVFCAEVASVTNETIVSRYLTEHAATREEKLRLINLQLDQIKMTFFRQVMFAEFELFIHETIEQGMLPATEELNDYWRGLNQKYYGPEITLDEESDYEWARIPHFYRDFYVYQYATGYAAASFFADRITKGSQDDRARYIDFLKSGGSDYPIELLKKAGVDMTGSQAFESVIKRFDHLLDELEEVYYGSEK